MNFQFVRVRARLAVFTLVALALGALAPAAATAAAPSPLLFRRAVYTGVPLPVFATGDGTGRFYVVSRAGRIYTAPSAGAPLSATPFLDISALTYYSAQNEEGLLGLAFSPNYASDGHFWIYYTSLTNSTMVVRYSRNATDSARADTSTASVVLTFSRPNIIHIGGNLAFGPDNYLYIGSGDGGTGGGGDLANLAQNTTTNFGKILRLDVMSTPTYTVPPSNPFADGVSGNPLVWDWGLRNPWRFSFDASGTLYIGDVGQDAWEEVDIEPPGTAGRNYGWHLWEGNHPYPPSAPTPSRTGMTFPAVEYPHPFGEAIVGGYVYEGSKFPAMHGRYFFGDYITAKVFELSAGPAPYSFATLADYPGLISSFGRDDSKELYCTDIGANAVYHVGDANVYSRRYAGSDRYAVAAQAGLAGTSGWANVHDVIITCGEDSAAADPLAASGLAGAYRAPILLVHKATTPTVTKQAIAAIAAANGPVRLHVVGGTSSVPDARIADIRAYVGASKIASSDRVAAADRYRLAGAIASKMRALHPSTPPTRALIANGETPALFFDALALSPISTAENAPILLVRQNSAPPATKSAIAALSSTDRWAAGNAASIAPATLASLGIPESHRLAGSDRYGTAEAVAAKAVGSWGLEASTTALAAKLPDALTGGAAVGLNRGVMLFTATTSLPGPSVAFLGSYQPQIARVWVFGGTGSITEDVRRQIAAIRDR